MCKNTWKLCGELCFSPSAGIDRIKEKRRRRKNCLLYIPPLPSLVTLRCLLLRYSASNSRVWSVLPLSHNSDASLYLSRPPRHLAWGWPAPTTPTRFQLESERGRHDWVCEQTRKHTSGREKQEKSA